MISPVRFCRMDEALVTQIATADRLGSLAVSAIATIIVGAGAYGFAFGIWRAPEQAVYAALKLPVLFLAIVLATTMLSAMIAILLRAPLDIRQSAVTILAGFATTAAILGALSPIATFVALAMPDPDLSVLGLALDDPRAAAANRSAQSLLLFHVAVIAVAGVLGNIRLFALLRRLSGGRKDIALRVLFAWLTLDLLAGSELSWLLRPFLGRPHRAPELLIREAFHGSFFTEIAEASMHALGPFGWSMIGMLLLIAIAAAIMFLRNDGLPVEVVLGARGLDVRGDEARFQVLWDDVAQIEAAADASFLDDGPAIVFEVRAAPVRRLRMAFADPKARDAFLDQAKVLRRRLGVSPYRSHDPR